VSGSLRGRSSRTLFHGPGWQTSIELLVSFGIVLGQGHMYGHLSLEPLWLLWDFKINLSSIFRRDACMVENINYQNCPFSKNKSSKSAQYLK
jgi:hypothetical protein